MNCGWDNHSNTTVCLKCGQPLRIPENYANSQDILFQRRPWRSYTQTDSIECQLQWRKCRKLWCFHNKWRRESFYCCTANYRMSQLQLPGSRRFHKLPLLRNSIKRANISTNNEYKTIRVEEEVPSVSEEKMLCHECGSKIAITCSFARTAVSAYIGQPYADK